MPVTTEDRAIIKHMDQPAKDNMLQEQLKRISIATNSGTFDRETVNDALDRLAIMLEPKPAPAAKPDPAPAKTKPVPELAD